MKTPSPRDMPPLAEPAAPFAVLCGPDFAGKSTVMAELARIGTPARLVSVDPGFVAPEHAVVTDLRRAVMAMLPSLGTGYSPELLLSVLQTAVVHLRDQVAADSSPAVVDSYYYKLLAKCRVLGLDDHPLYAWWRSFPRPYRVFWLEVSPATAWRRSAGRVNRLEHHGHQLVRDSFDAFQRELGKLMLDEVSDLPLTVLPEHHDVAHTARAIAEALDNDT
jgi:thymidylate kinase